MNAVLMDGFVLEAVFPGADDGGSVQMQLDAQRVEIEQLKEDVSEKKSLTDCVAGELQTRVDAQDVEIVNLATDIVAQKEKSDAISEVLQTQIDAQQVSIVHLNETVESQTKVIDKAMGDSAASDEKREAYTDYLKASADDLRGQYQREQRAHHETQKKLIDAMDVSPAAISEDSENRSRE